MHRNILLALMLFASVTTACASKVETSGDVPPVDSGVDGSTSSDVAVETATDAAVLPTEERTCKRLADAMCGKATEACCGTLGITYAGGGCREATMAWCSGLIDAVAAGKATYDDSQLEACAKSWESSISKCQTEFIPYLRQAVACAHLFNGTKAPGSPCTSSAECMAPAGMSTYCDNTAKRCRASSVVPAGSTCNFTGSTLRYCDEGLYCDLTGATAECKPQLAEGAACSSSNYIACGYSHTCVADKCGTGLAGGETCATGPECSSWTCTDGKCNSVLYPMVDKGLCNGGTAG